jgi:hypothetical protein
MDEPLTTESYDLEAVYDSEIAPLVAQIHEICRRIKMPYVASFAVRRDEAGEYDLCSSALAWADRRPNTYNQITRMLIKD